MTPVDLVGDSAGLIAGLSGGLSVLTSTVEQMQQVVAVLVVAVALLLGVEIVRGVMRR